jgi:hypothetical protein
VTVSSRQVRLAEQALESRARGNRDWSEAARVAVTPVVADIEHRMLELQASHQQVCEHPAHSSSVCPTCYTLQYALAIVNDTEPKLAPEATTDQAHSIRIFTNDPKDAVAIAEQYVNLFNSVGRSLGAPRDLIEAGEMYTRCDFPGCSAVTAHGGTEGWTHRGVEDFCPDHPVDDEPEVAGEPA